MFQVPFVLLKYTDVRFNWKNVRNLVRQLADDFDDELAQEAAYRTHGNPVTAPAYCSAHEAEIAGTRNPVPPADAPDPSVLAETGNTPVLLESDASGSRAPDPEAMSLDTSPETSAETLDDLISRLPENDEVASESGADVTPKAAKPATSTGEGGSTEQPTAETFNLLKKDLDDSRAKLRENLIDQCLDVVRTHPDTAIEISELISTVVLRHQEEHAHKEVGSTLTEALSSIPTDENEKKTNGKCIAAYAHLLALLLQDETFFDKNIDTLRERIDEYVALLKVSPSTSAEDLPPWIPFILLVLETLLSHDEKPTAVQWNMPKSLDDPVVAPVLTLKSPLVNDELRSSVLESLLELLPRIGKGEMLATAILRVLIILTRKRQLAKQVGEKKNLQRLFLMAKQMSGAGSERLRQTRLTAHLITILRHIVEDEDVIKQVMRAEIKSDLPNLQRTQRGHLDVSTYLRGMAPIALRAPDLFVEVTNELLRFSRWSAPTGEGARSQALVWKEQPDSDANVTQSDAGNAQAEDVKQSTESGDKEMSDAHKSHHDSKRPVVENPDGVIHFLLCELVNYREVEDKEVPKPSKDVASESESTTAAETQQDNSSVDSLAGDGKDKKPAKPTFKPEEHPIFVYRCFLLSCLAELLQSYTRTKVEFINFKRSAPPLSNNTPVKPRSSILNYLIYDLLCQSNLSGTTDNIASKKKAATSSQTQKVLVALVSKTNEKVFERKQEKYAYDDEPDLLFVRKFVLDTILKAYEKAPLTDEPLEVRYARMQCLAELMNHMVGERDKDQSSGSRNADGVQPRSQAQLRRLMYEKGYLDKLTSSIAEINLNFPGVKRAIKYILRVLRVLTDTAKELSHSNILVNDSQADQSDEDFASTSSLSDLDEGREETPDLYRNSALGMLEPRGEDDESESEEEDNGDEDMYGDDYDDDEMDYGDEDISDDEDNISDEDEELSDMGEIEGLHGDPGVVEVIMDDDEDDEDDSDEDDEDDEDDEVDSADMEDIEDRVEIVDEDGNLIEDDGESGWESETSAEEDDGPEVDIDYEGEVQDADEAHLHGMGPGDLLDNMARAIMGGDEDVYEPELMEALDEHYLDDDHDEGGTYNISLPLILRLPLSMFYEHEC